MQTKKKQLDIYLIALAMFVITSVTLRTVALMRHFDPALGYFVGSPLIRVADWFTVGAGILLLSYFLTVPRGTSLVASFVTPATYVPTALVGIALINFSFSIFANNLKGALGTELLLGIATAVLAIAAIYHFFLNAFIRECSDTTRAGASFVTVILLCVYPAYLYFSTKASINSPNKIVDQMAFLFSAIYFLYESRISLGRERWRAYVSFGLLASLLTAYSSIPSVIVYFAKGLTVSDSIAESALTLTLFIFITARLLLVRGLKEDKRADIVDKIIAINAEIRERIGDSDLVVAAPEQLSFDLGEVAAADESENESDTEESETTDTLHENDGNKEEGGNDE